MKKYIKPEIFTITVETESIMETSKTFNMNDATPKNDNNDNMFSKGHNVDIWGFDEDED